MLFRTINFTYDKYYRIYVKNYIVYYVVIDDEGPDKIIEIRRFLYNKQNQKKSFKENKEEKEAAVSWNTKCKSDCRFFRFFSGMFQ